MQQRLDEMEPALRELNVLDGWRRQLSALDQQLSAIDPAIGEHVERVQHALNEAEALVVLLPWLRQWVAARQQWHQCGEELSLLTVHQHDLEGQWKRSLQEKEALEERLEGLCGTGKTGEPGGAPSRSVGKALRTA